MVLRARSGSTWMYWWSPVTSAKAFTRSWVTSTHLPTPISWPTNALSSSMLRTSSGISTSRGTDWDASRGEPERDGALAVEVGVAVEWLQVLGALEEKM